MRLRDLAKLAANCFDNEKALDKIDREIDSLNSIKEIAVLSKKIKVKNKLIGLGEFENLKNFASSISNIDSEGDIKKIDKKLNELYKLRYISQAIDISQRIESQIFGFSGLEKMEKLKGKMFNFRLSDLQTIPSSFGICFKVGDIEGDEAFIENDSLERFFKGKSLFDKENKFQERFSFEVDYSLQDRILLSLIGEKLFFKFLEMKMDFQLGM